MGNQNTKASGSFKDAHGKLNSSEMWKHLLMH